jgi:hypothetical protein
MKIALTGHTRGVGKSLLDLFKSNGHTVIGFSKSQGFDISDPVSIEKILDSLADCDVFINNAYCVIGQKTLLVRLINQWEGTNKVIVNINSKASLIPDKLLNSDAIPLVMKEYVANKKEQTNIIMDRIFKASPHIINIVTGIIDTNMSKEFNCKKLSTNDLAKFIYMLVEFKDIVAVQNIIVDVPGLDWENIKRK